jgi:hypothetical protein
MRTEVGGKVANFREAAVSYRGDRHSSFCFPLKNSFTFPLSPAKLIGAFFKNIIGNARKNLYFTYSAPEFWFGAPNHLSMYWCYAVQTFKSRRILKYIIIHAANSAFIMQFMQEYLSFILMCSLYLLDLHLPSTSVADPRMFIPDPNFSISDPRSRVKKAPDPNPQQTQISVTKLLEIWSVVFLFF